MWKQIFDEAILNMFPNSSGYCLWAILYDKKYLVDGTLQMLYYIKEAAFVKKTATYLLKQFYSLSLCIWLLLYFQTLSFISKVFLSVPSQMYNKDPLL